MDLVTFASPSAVEGFVITWRQERGTGLRRHRSRRRQAPPAQAGLDVESDGLALPRPKGWWRRSSPLDVRTTLDSDYVTHLVSRTWSSSRGALAGCRRLEQILETLEVSQNRNAGNREQRSAPSLPSASSAAAAELASAEATRREDGGHGRRGVRASPRHVRRQLQELRRGRSRARRRAAGVGVRGHRRRRLQVGGDHPHRRVPDETGQDRRSRPATRSTCSWRRRRTRKATSSSPRRKPRR